MTKKPDKYHCKTCGADYESTGEEYERGDGMMMWRLHTPHACPLPQNTFYIETKVEYEWVEGELFQRKIRFRRYSGHDTVGMGRNGWKPCTEIPDGVK